jgi:membrane protein implicated in regulation of membrane protease activity
MMGIRRAMGPWIDAARGLGLALILVGGSAALGLIIAWPLWLLATHEGRIYTILVLALAGSGILFLIVRAALRRRNEPHDPGKARRTPLSLLLSVFIVFFACCGAYAESVLVFSGLWTYALLTLPVLACILWLLGLARRAVKARAAKKRKEPRPPAENRDE